MNEREFLNVKVAVTTAFKINVDFTFLLPWDWGSEWISFLKNRMN